MQRVYDFFYPANPEQAEKQLLLRAAKEGQAEVLEQYFTSTPFPEKINSIIDEDGNTLLIIACLKNMANCVTLLLSQGADPNRYSNKGSTALVHSAENGFSVITKLLLHGGANVNQGNLSENTTPLYLAAQNGHESVVRILLEYKADPNLSCTDGEVPLSGAIRNDHGQIVSMLLNGGADVNKMPRMSSRSTVSLLDSICDSGNFAALTVLLKKQGISLPLEIPDDVENIPTEFRCPITKCPMQDPVTVSTGHTYERDSLIQLFKSSGNPVTAPCPLSTFPINRHELLNGTNIAIRTSIETCIENAKTIKRQITSYQP